MNVVIEPHKLSGYITAPLSKSEAIRMLICASLCHEPVKLFIGQEGLLSDDIEAAVDCIKTLGAEIFFTDDGFINITPINPANIPECPVLNCRESGAALRFLLPVVSALCERAYFTGTGRLPERPISELMNVMKAHGVNFSADNLPFEISGKLQSGKFELAGNISSQYITGLMLALPLLKGSSTIELTSKLKSSSYIDITISTLKKFGVNVEQDGNKYFIDGDFVSPGAVSIGGDWSGAAFFLAAGALAGSVSVMGLSTSSAQGDKKILDVLASFGADVKVSRNSITVSRSSGKFKRLEIDIDPIPDLLPVLAVAASCTGCEAKFCNASRLRLKESDRILSTASIVRSLGGFAHEKPDELFVSGSTNLTGGLAEGFHDHRIVMAAAIAGVKCRSEVIITNAESSRKSYPNFFRDYKILGGCVHAV